MKKRNDGYWRALCHILPENFFPSLRIAPWMPNNNGCGWIGEWRKRLETANQDAEKHQKTHSTKPPYTSTEGCCWPEKHPNVRCKNMERL